MSASSQRLIGQILLKNGACTPEQLDEGLAKQDITQKRIGEILIELGHISEDDLLKALSEQLGLPYLGRLTPEMVERDLVARVPRNFAQTYKIIPVRREGGAVSVATSDPLNTQPLDDIGLILESEIRTVLAGTEDIARTINTVYAHAEGAAEELIEDMGEEQLAEGEKVFDLSEQKVEDLMDIDDKAPVIKLVNLIIYQAAKSRASDIHIEPYEKELKVRFRIDGAPTESDSPIKPLQTIS